MPQSLSKVYVHIVFSTKNRQNIIDDAIETSLHEYLGGVCKGLECNPVRIGGYKDHIHVLCLLSRKIAQIKLLEELKKQSSKWIKTKDNKYSDFYWQDGYAIFSVNPTEIGKVIDYIEKQHEHHSRKSFQDEFRAFLKNIISNMMNVMFGIRLAPLQGLNPITAGFTGRCPVLLLRPFQGWFSKLLTVKI